MNVFHLYFMCINKVGQFPCLTNGVCLSRLGIEKSTLLLGTLYSLFLGRDSSIVSRTVHSVCFLSNTISGRCIFYSYLFRTRLKSLDFESETFATLKQLELNIKDLLHLTFVPPFTIEIVRCYIDFTFVLVSSSLHHSVTSLLNTILSHFHLHSHFRSLTPLLDSSIHHGERRQ